MPFIGNQPALNYTSLVTQTFTAVTGQTQYSLDHSVANGNDILLYISNVKQVEGSGNSYTASGNTLTLNTSISAGTEMYCLYLSKAIQTVTPPNNSVTNAMLGETITVAKGGTGLTSGFKNGITMADSWKITNSQTISADTDTVINSSWTRNSTEYSQIGTGLTESSGVFTFPQTGIYLINSMAQVADATDMRYIAWDIEYSTDSGSNFSDLTKTYTFIKTTSGATTFSNINASISIDVTNISTSRLRFVIGGDEQFILSGNASSFRTGFQIIRLGD